MAILFEDFLQLFPNAQRYEKYILVRCPFHNDNNPSLMIFRDGWFRCLGGSCGRQGTWLTLWNKLKGQPVQVMQEIHTQWNGPKIDEDLEGLCYQAHLDLIQFPTFQWYLEIRGIQGRIESNELGYWNGWYTIPIRDRNGNFVTAVLRAAPHVQEVTKLRYWSHHAPVMYVPDWRLYETNDYCVVVYGMFDALALADLRLPVVTASSGNMSFDPLWLDDCRKPIIIVPDKEEETVAIKLSARLGWRGRVFVPDYPEGMKDPADLYKAGLGNTLFSDIERIAHAKTKAQKATESSRNRIRFGERAKYQ